MAAAVALAVAVVLAVVAAVASTSKVVLVVVVSLSSRSSRSTLIARRGGGVVYIGVVEHPVGALFKVILTKSIAVVTVLDVTLNAHTGPVDAGLHVTQNKPTPFIRDDQAEMVPEDS